jgi:hypothetical protein
MLRAVFAIRKGAVSLDTFIAELKAAKLIADTGLTPEELLIVKDTFTRASSLANDEKLVAEMEKAASEGDWVRVKELTEGRSLYKKGISKTTPTKTPDEKAIPRGSKTKVNQANDKETARSLVRENESAVILAQKGYDIEQNPMIIGTTKKPDYLIENNIFDCYAPSGNNARNILSNIRFKITNDQSYRIVLNLDDSDISITTIKAELQKYPITGLEEIIIIQNNNVLQFYPF